MNHKEIIKYIKTNFKNMLDEKIKSFEQSLKNNLKKQYKLKNPILHEYCIINTIEEFNKLLSIENITFSSEIDADTDKYILTVDNDFFNKHINISNDKIIPIKIEKIITEADELSIDDTEDTQVKILSFEKNNYCGYILHEIKIKTYYR